MCTLFPAALSPCLGGPCVALVCNEEYKLRDAQLYNSAYVLICQLHGILSF